MWKDVTLHIWIWISTFKGTGNRLPKHCNRLQLFEINWTFVNSIGKLFQNNFATGNRLQQSGNRLPESKNSLVIMFWEKSMCYSVFEKTFLYLSWLSLLLILESWSWFLEAWTLNLDSWNQISSWTLKCSWFNLEHILWFLRSSSLLSWSVLDFWAFCHHLCYHQSSFESILIHHEACFYKRSSVKL